MQIFIFRTVGIILGLTALFCVWGGIYTILEVKNINKHGIRTTGKISKVRIVDLGTRGGYEYDPTVNFQTKAGKEITGKPADGEDSRNEDAYVVGNEVKIVYDRKDPKHFYIVADSSLEKYELGLAFFLMAALSMVFARMFYSYLPKYIKHQKEQNQELNNKTPSINTEQRDSSS